jgi:hypothetical protein
MALSLVKGKRRVNPRLSHLGLPCLLRAAGTLLASTFGAFNNTSQKFGDG